MVHGDSDVARKSLLPLTSSHRLRCLSSCLAWPAPPNADDASADQSDVVPSGASVAPMVHGDSDGARKSLLPLTSSHRLRCLSSCLAWPAPPNADDASADQSGVAPRVHGDVARKSLLPLPSSHRLRCLSSCLA